MVLPLCIGRQFPMFLLGVLMAVATVNGSKVTASLSSGVAGTGRTSRSSGDAAVAHNDAHYNLVARESVSGLRRRQRRNAQSSQTVTSNDTSVAATAAPSLISFDGDLNAIHQLALTQASQSPDIRESFSCDDEETVHLEIIDWKYSIETVPTAVIPTVYGEVQEIALEHVAPHSLVCLNQTAAFAHIVALDTAIPGDHESGDTCDPILDSSNICTNVIGRMRIFLSNKDSVDVATALVVQNIKAAFRDADFVHSVGSGLLRIAFVEMDSASSENPIKEAATAEHGKSASPDSNTAPIDGDDNSSLGLTLTSVLSVALSGFGLIFLVGSVYLWRRRGQTDDDQDGVATRLANSSSFQETTTLDHNNSRVSGRPTSPYSEMVSSSYRLDRLGELSILSNSNMSPVYEQDQEDADTAAGSIVLSEGGYTTDAAGTEGGDSTYFNEGGSSKYSSSQQSEPMYLGARPFPGTVNMNMDEISDSDLDTSGEMSPVKMYVGNKLLLSDGIIGANHDEEDCDDESLLFSPAPKSTAMANASEHDEEAGDIGGGGTTVMSDMLSMSPQYEAETVMTAPSSPP